MNAKKLIITSLLASLSAPVFATGNHNPPSPTPASSTRSDASASAVQYQGQVQSQVGINAATGGNSAATAGGSSITQGNVRSLSLGFASAPSPANCTTVLPELGGLITITQKIRHCILGAISQGYLAVGAFQKAEKVLDTLAKEEGIDFGKTEPSLGGIGE